jgi:hypothetical protein
VIIDLVSPWCTAVEAADSARARSTFRGRHTALLETLRRQRAPLADILPLGMDARELRRLARRAADPDGLQGLRDALARAAQLGADGCAGVVLLAGDGTGDTAESLPWPSGEAVLFLDRAHDDRDLIAALGQSVAALTRCRATDSKSPVRRWQEAPWDRWQACRDLLLREWIYIAGLGAHLAQALLPEVAPHQILGMTQAAFARLRQRERVYHALLTADLDQSGLGLVLRWLTPAAPIGPRTVAGLVLPPFAGHYLAWRMLAGRVARVGLREAIRMAA